MTNTPTPRAAIYTRISSDRTGAGLGVDRQRIECEELAERIGASVVRVFTDDDISASSYSRKPRPAYRALLELIGSGGCDVVIAWHTDRLTRRPAELEEYVSATEAAGVTTHTVQAGMIDLSTPSGRMIARQLGAVAAFESEHKSERIRSSKRQAALAGRSLGGQRPFGWNEDRVTLKADEAEVIREASRRVVAGESISSITKDLKARGVTLAQGSELTGISLRDYLMRPRNAGLSVYRGQVVGTGEWEPIIPEETFRAVERVLTDPRRVTTPGTRGAKWLGSGLYRCGVCEGPLIVTKRSGSSVGHGRVYSCRESKHVSIGHAETDEYVRAVLAGVLQQPEVLDRFTAEEDTDAVRAVREEVAATRIRLEAVPADYAAGLLDGAQAQEATRLLRGRIETLEASLATRGTSEATAGLVAAEDPGDWFLDAPVGTQRVILSALATVTVRRGQRGRPPGWKPGETYWDHRRIDIQPKGK